MATGAKIPRVKKVREATMRQKKAIELMVANGGTASNALRQAGYSEAIAQNPQKVTRSESFIALAAECGLTDLFLTKALVADIKAKKKNRKPELELGYKVLGRLKEREDPGGDHIYNFNFFDADQLRKIAARTVDGDPASA